MKTFDGKRVIIINIELIITKKFICCLGFEKMIKTNDILKIFRKIITKHSFTSLVQSFYIILGLHKKRNRDTWFCEC